MASSHHSRKPSSRAALPRRTTKGPLDAPSDPLSSIETSPTSPDPRAALQPSSEDGPRSERSSTNQASRTSSSTGISAIEERDLSFLLDASIYHPLSQLEVPGPFRKAFLPGPTADTVERSMGQLDSLLSQCDFLRAAQLAGSILTSGTIRPTDIKTVFRLLAIRYSCLELSGNLLLAAQEAKALEDLSSAFYYDDPNPEEPASEDIDLPRKVPHHIMPFSLRLQALRLQSIGFSDPRRGVTTLYDLAFECREHLSTPGISVEDHSIWTERLQEMSIRVVNALIEMGELDCAARTLATMKPSDDKSTALWTSRMVLLRIKMGDFQRAHDLVESTTLATHDKLALRSLLAIAEGRYDEASQAFSECEEGTDPALKALIKQNLAVALLYNGEVSKSKKILEELIDNGYSFQTLTINLATIYDLSSDTSRDLKLSMISKIASEQKTTGQLRSFLNADFKL
ncbi:uncharacterized protein PV06_08979 [Exophiala oligosperma]|uniref:Uncharacterized protein n=2 Tax=Chaetothyriales TaxID=34395 RepID=A0A0D2D7R1_9EURO|nr:uncharacterized protein PV06_08979 [Exophiala oligosperma]KAJ9643850.1 hypothetical protein H2204_001995 [Knufia peltigerae]KIW39178.1 hypothetical protein PV06_08979 [Exophiala oligosperma]